MITRVARNPLTIPSGVKLSIAERSLTVAGPLGELSMEIHPSVSISQEGDGIRLAPFKMTEESNALTGTMASLAGNMLKGVTEGFTCKLLLDGVGYRARVEGDRLVLMLGFSHPVKMKMPAGITLEVPTQTEIVLRGADKQQVFQMGANIRAKRPPDPYKGKGIRYHDEVVILKETRKKK